MVRRVVPNMSTPIVNSFEIDDKISNTNDASFGKVLKRFATETTAHGPFHIAASQNVISKVFWTVMLIFAAGVLFWQSYELVTDYDNYNTVSEVVHSDSIPFPAVTVCNVNKMKRSLLTTNEKFSEVVRLDGGWQEAYFEEYDWFWEGPPSWWYDYSELYNETYFYRGSSGTSSTANGYPDPEEVRGPEDKPTHEWDDDPMDDWYYDYGIGGTECDAGDPKKYFDNLGSNNFLYGINRLFTPTRVELEKLGHQKKDFILQCSFNGRKCSDRNFTTFQSARYGNCFTFDGASDNVVTKAGSYYGLHLTLFIEEPEYVGLFSEEAGARLLVHPKEIYPHIEDLGITLPPGFSTQVGIRQVQITRLNLPYYNCSRGSSDGHISMRSYNYSIISCQKKCLLDAMRQNCSCVSEIYDDYDGVRLCTCKDERCRQRIENLFNMNNLSCNCLPPCNEIVYNTQMSSSHWPTRRYQEHLLEKLRVGDRVAARVLENPTAVRDNLVRVKVYFQELNYERIQQTPKHTIPSLFGAIGGIFGLYVGFSIFTFAEIIVLLFDIIKTLIFRSD